MVIWSGLLGFFIVISLQKLIKGEWINIGCGGGDAGGDCGDCGGDCGD